MSDTVNFWKIFHALLRADSSKEEGERAAENLRWATDHIVQLRAVCMPDYELDLIGIVWNYWHTHKASPSLQMVKELVLKIEKSQPLQDALDEYTVLVEESSELRPFDSQDLYQILRDKTDEFELYKLNLALDLTKKVANSSLEDPKTKKKLSGTKDALNYILGKIQDGLFTDAKKSVGGSIKGTSNETRDDYQKTKRENLQGTLIMKTGITEIDQVIRGLRRGAFWGVLGYAGQRKSSLCRTIAYNVAQAGFNVMVVPLEQAYEEERNIYAVMHSHHPKFGGKFKISISALDEGILTPAEEDFLFNVVIPDLDHMKGDLIIRQPQETTWAGITAQAEIQHQITPLDLLVVDYWALMDISYASGGNERQVVNGLIKQGKQWCLAFDNKRGIGLLTPVQGNREGYDDASNADGKWEMDGVYDFSEFDKSLDGCLYTWSDSNLAAIDQIKLGCCKGRRSGTIPPFYAKVSPSGLIFSQLGSSKVEEQTLNDLLDPVL
jgi:hypothetical protein